MKLIIGVFVLFSLVGCHQYEKRNCYLIRTDLAGEAYPSWRVKTYSCEIWKDGIITGRELHTENVRIANYDSADHFPDAADRAALQQMCPNCGY